MKKFNHYLINDENVFFCKKDLIILEPEILIWDLIKRKIYKKNYLVK